MFAIGDQDWPGISKLVEEMGEVQQICGKLLGTRGDTKHWNVPDLKAALEDELADLKAAIEFLIRRGGLNSERIRERHDAKVLQFERWHGVEVNS